MLDAAIYTKAADIIEKGWVQNAFAKDKCGKSTHPCRYDAERWCLSGALIAAVFIIKGDHLSYCPNNLTEGLMLEVDVIEWNDHPDRTKGQVVAILQRAATKTSLLEG